MNEDLVLYYKDRAKEYEKIYNRPERQKDLLKATEILQQLFTDKEVLEIACGTGYWTYQIAKTAKTILATDINESVIEIAKSKSYSPAKVTFQLMDIYNLQGDFKHENLFGGFIWSHIELGKLNSFIASINKNITKGGTVVFIDNLYVQGSNLPITETDKNGNTYQTRLLENGSTHKVLKNFPTEEFIRELLEEKASNIAFLQLEYYWILKYDIE